MNTLKKIFVFVLTTALLAVMLCGCNSGNEDGTGDSTQGTTTAPTETQLVIPTFTTAPANDGKVTYTVTVVDQNNNPIEGVTVQFCDEENCKLPVNTDANGVVTGTYAPSEYHITLVELPVGYTTDETVFYFGDSTELTIVLNVE